MKALFKSDVLDEEQLEPEIAQLRSILILSYRLRLSTIAKANFERIKNTIVLKPVQGKPKVTLQLRKMDLMKKVTIIDNAKPELEKQFEKQRLLLNETSHEILKQFAMSSEKSWTAEIEALKTMFCTDLISSETKQNQLTENNPQDQDNHSAERTD